MHVKVSTVRRGEKTYKYAQLVESYRRERDGKPTIRVIASLGRVTDREVENLRLALKANATGQALTVAPSVADKVEVAACKPYLDCAVLAELWEQVGLRRLVEHVLDDATDAAGDVAAERCVAALAIQRCIEPGSKLFAQRWFPRTALPALLNVRPSKFNNSRIHRVLDLVASREDSLQRAWSKEQKSHAFTALFLDTSDTWFVGSGPDIAHMGRTKEGMFRQKVGVALLCEQDETPLRWKTFPGNQHEAEPMLAIARQVADEGWATDVPLVVDRGLGSAAFVGELVDLGVRFIAAIPRHEFEAYAPELVGDTAPPLCSARSIGELTALGFERVSDTCFARDLGIRSRTDTRPGPKQITVSRSAYAMTWLAKLEAIRTPGHTPSSREAARELGVSGKFVRSLMPLLELPTALREAIANEATPTATMEEIRHLASLEAEPQRVAFEALSQRPGKPRLAQPVGSQAQPRPSLSVRCVAYFNPEQHEHQRRSAEERALKVQRRINELNARLQRSPQRSDTSILAEVGQWLRRHGMLSLYTLSVDRASAYPQLRATRDEVKWQRRRRLDGLSLIVASTACAQPSAELVATYRARQAIERGFRDIKSVIGLRPVHHRTDDKVRAHVTICVLALILQRALRQRLDRAQLHYTAERALEELDSCRLLELASPGHRAMKPIITQPNPIQREILSALDMTYLGEGNQL